MEKTVKDVVESVVKKNPGKTRNFYIMKAVEEYCPEVKGMDLKSFKKTVSSPDFPSLVTFDRYIRNC